MSIAPTDGGTKFWFLEVWNRTSLADIWRVEFQVRRTALKQFGINTYDELEAALGGLWKYLTETSFSLRLPDDSNTTRRTVHPWWRAVQACASKFGPTLSHLRVCRKLIVADAEGLSAEEVEREFHASARRVFGTRYRQSMRKHFGGMQ